jgi:hypothetical protein
MQFINEHISIKISDREVIEHKKVNKTRVRSAFEDTAGKPSELYLIASW